MGDKIATRAAYGDALVELGAQYPDLVVLDADLSGSTMTKDFARAYPDRFFNMGIAEADMMGAAAGAASASGIGADARTRNRRRSCSSSLSVCSSA